jgi:hypothetical protein
MGDRSFLESQDVFGPLAAYLAVRKRLASLERANGELPDVSQHEVPNLLSSPNIGFEIS